MTDELTDEPDILNGAPEDDSYYIHSEEDLEKWVDRIGFLPLFAGDVAGFSVEEHTVPENWWTEDPERDPWVWREMAARRGHIAYGKFFNNRAGFISRKWLPVFANYRRDGYDFDARWDDELASFRQKKIMDLFMEEKAGNELFSFEVKQQAGFGKNGEKNFEGTLTGLEMQIYLVVRDFRQQKNKKGMAYGWPIAVLATPEHLFGADLVRQDYDKDPKESLAKIARRVLQCCPDADERAILKLVAYSEDRPAAKKKSLPYPQNLLKMIDKQKDPWTWTSDQIDGLYVSLGQLRPKQQRVLWEKFHEGKTNEEIGVEMNRAAGTIGTYRGKAMRRLRDPLVAAWYRDGYKKNLKACAAGEHWPFEIADPGDELGEDDLCLRLGIKVDIFEKMARYGIITIGDLMDAMKNQVAWYKPIYGVGIKSAEDIQNKLTFHSMRKNR